MMSVFDRCDRISGDRNRISGDIKMLLLLDITKIRHASWLQFPAPHPTADDAPSYLPLKTACLLCG